MKNTGKTRSCPSYATTPNVAWDLFVTGNRCDLAADLAALAVPYLPAGITKLRGLPKTGKPFSWVEHPYGKQMRQYGPDGKPQVDIDFGHDHGQGIPHAHNWENGVRQPGLPVSVIPKK